MSRTRKRARRRSTRHSETDRPSSRQRSRSTCMISDQRRRTSGYLVSMGTRSLEGVVHRDASACEALSSPKRELPARSSPDRICSKGRRGLRGEWKVEFKIEKRRSRRYERRGGAGGTGGGRDEVAVGGQLAFRSAGSQSLENRLPPLPRDGCPWGHTDRAGAQSFTDSHHITYQSQLENSVRQVSRGRWQRSVCDV